MESRIGIGSGELPLYLRKQLEEALRPNEKLLWVDMPITGDVAIKSLLISVIASVLLGVWISAGFSETVAGTLPTLAAAVAICWPLISWLRAKRTAYAITSMRLIEIQMWALRTVKAISLDAPLALDIHLWDHGSGTMRFFDRLGTSGDGGSPPPTLIFKSVADAKRVAGLVQSLRDLPLPTVS